MYNRTRSRRHGLYLLWSDEGCHPADREGEALATLLIPIAQERHRRTDSCPRELQECKL